MLKLLAMLTAGKAFLLASLILAGFFPQSAGKEIVVSAPAEGGYLQGAVIISGEINVKGFVSYEVAFAYDDSRETPAWFLIKRDLNQVQKGTLATWDTTTITDGRYQLRVLVKTGDGREVSEVVKGLHVSNYSPIPGGAAVPTPLPQSKAVQPTPVGVRTALQLPPNPAEISREEVGSSAGRGLAGVLIVFAILGLYLAARAGLRKL